MNQRIKELAEQAGITLSQKDYSYYWVESAEDIEKFAELIVKECMDLVASRPYVDDGNWSHPSMMIKQHFGVEE